MTHARLLNPLFGRRAAMLGAAVACAAAGPPPAVMPDGATLLVAGPAGGRLDQWGDLVAPCLARGLPGAPRLTRRTLGGVDGVTGANGFDALVTPDGATALLLPGAAALAWLAGDRRARFDPARWVPVWAACGSAVLLSRGPLTPGRPLRLPASGPAGPVVPMLLALDLLGVAVTLLPPAAEASPADVDAVFLSGPGTQAAAASLQAAGLRPVLALGMLDGAGAWGRDLGFPDVPTVVHQVAARQAPAALDAALRAASAAVQMDAALVLPGLAPRDLAAAWQRTGISASPDVLTAAAAQGVRPKDAAGAGAILDAVAAGAPAIPALQRWLATRYA